MNPILVLEILLIAIVAVVVVCGYEYGWFARKTYTTICRLRGSAMRGNLFGPDYQTDVWLILRQCDQTKKYSAYMTDGQVKQSFDTEVAIEQATLAGYTIN